MSKHMEIDTIIFDLDGTLISEHSADAEAFLETSQLASKVGVNPQSLATFAEAQAKKLFRNEPCYDFARRIGAGSRSSLCSDFQFNDSRTGELRELALGYRINMWRNALKEFGCENAELAQELAQSYRRIRRSHYKLYVGVGELLERLSLKFKLGIITNGFTDLQEEKIHLSGADRYITHHTISGNIGVGKPSPEIFKAALESLGSDAGGTLMVGNSKENDILGAANLGMRTVLIAETISDSTPSFVLSHTRLLETVL